VLPPPGRGPDNAPGIDIEVDKTEQDELDTDNANELDADGDAGTDDKDILGRTDTVFAQQGFSNIYEQMSDHRRELNDPRLGSPYVIDLILELVENGGS
jgi:hypothetical protein